MTVWRCCRNCDRPTDAAICSTCSGELARALAGVPELVEQLYVSYTKQDRFSAGGRRGKGDEAPLPVRFDIQRVVDRLSNTLTTWARDLVDVYMLDVPDPARRRPHNTSKASVPDLEARNLARGEFGRGIGSAVFPVSSPALDVACYAASWLAEHVTLIRRHPAALEAFTGLTGAIARAALAMDRPEVSPFIGYCDECSGPLYGDHRTSGTRCERCGTYYSDVSERWETAKRKLEDYPATAALIAGSIGELYGVMINRKRINLWHFRREIRAVDSCPDTGAPRFRIGDVLDRARRSKPRQAG